MGGETTTFSDAFSKLDELIEKDVHFLTVYIGCSTEGEAPTTLGGVSSNHPPSGCPILAHDTNDRRRRVIRLYASVIFFISY